MTMKEKIAAKAAATKEVATAAQRPKTLSEQMEAMRPEIRKLAGKHTDRVIRLAMSQVRTNLAQCSMPSIMGAVMNSAAVGLEPGPLGHVWLIPFRNNKTNTVECQFQIGVRGWIKLARNAGCFLDAKCVYENDTFSYSYGFQPELTHIPAASNRGKLVYVYCVAVLPSGHRQLEVMSVEDVEKVRKVSKAQASGPWIDWYDEMCKKTVIKRAAKMLPLDTNFEKAMAYDSTVNTLTRVETDFGQVLPVPAIGGVPSRLSIEADEVTETTIDESGMTQMEMAVVEEVTEEEAANLFD